MKESNDTVTWSLRLDPELKKNIKIAAAIEDESMQKWIAKTLAKAAEERIESWLRK